MSSEIVQITQLLCKASDEELYVDLIQQVNKDFLLANISSSLSELSTPEEVKQQLFIIIEKLINSQFDDFLNLLYRIDISETEIRYLDKENHKQYIASVSYLILKREWQKVWLRKNY